MRNPIAIAALAIILVPPEAHRTWAGGPVPACPDDAGRVTLLVLLRFCAVNGAHPVDSLRMRWQGRCSRPMAWLARRFPAGLAICCLAWLPVWSRQWSQS